MKAFVRRTDRGIEAADRHSDAALHTMKLGRVYQVEVKQPRNVRHHRMYWGLMNTVAENMDADVSAETVSDVVKVRAGHVNVVKTAKGEVFLPASISFASMDQGEFSQFFDRVVEVVVSDILPGVNRADLEREVLEIIGC